VLLTDGAEAEEGWKKGTDWKERTIDEGRRVCAVKNSLRDNPNPPLPP